MASGPTRADRGNGGSTGGFNVGGWLTWGRDILSTVFNPKGGGSQPVLSPEQLRNAAAQAADRRRLDAVADEPKQPKPTTPDTWTYYQPAASINEPKRMSGRKAKKVPRGYNERRIAAQLAAQGIWPYSMLSSELSTGTKVLQTISQAGLNLAMAGGTARNLPRTPPMGSRSSQRGFVGTVTSGPAAAARSIGKQQAAARARTTMRPVARGIYPQAMPGEFDPKPGEELAPAVAPGGGDELSPVKVPKRYKSDISPVEVPERRKYGNGGLGTGAGEPVRARSGSAPAMPGTGGKPQPAGKSTAGTAAGRGTKAVPRSAPGASLLPLDALLNAAARALTKRTPQGRNSFPGLGATSPGTGTRPGTAPQTRPQPDYMNNYPGAPGRSGDCDCGTGKKKPSKPRKPRSECWKGSYTETAKGIKKTRREQVSC